MWKTCKPLQSIADLQVLLFDVDRGDARQHGNPYKSLRNPTFPGRPQKPLTPLTKIIVSGFPGLGPGPTPSESSKSAYENQCFCHAAFSASTAAMWEPPQIIDDFIRVKGGLNDSPHTARCIRHPPLGLGDRARKIATGERVP